MRGQPSGEGGGADFILGGSPPPHTGAGAAVDVFETTLVNSQLLFLGYFCKEHLIFNFAEIQNVNLTRDKWLTIYA